LLTQGDLPAPRSEVDVRASRCVRQFDGVAVDAEFVERLFEVFGLRVLGAVLDADALD